MSSPFVLREPPQIMFMAFASPSVRHVALLAPVQRIDFASKTPSHTRGSRSSPSTTPARADKKRRFLVFNSKFPTPFFLTCPKPVLADRFGLRKRRRKQRRFLPPAPSSASHAAIAAAVAACCFDAAINPPCRNSASRLKIDYRKRSICRDRLGTNIGNTRKRDATSAPLHAALPSAARSDRPGTCPSGSQGRPLECRRSRAVRENQQCDLFVRYEKFQKLN